MDRVVAVKLIAPERVEDRRARAWFIREVQAAKDLHHPNIATAYDADEVDGTLLYAMEYIDGPTLEHLVRKQGPLPIRLACEMLHQAAKALAYAHEKGMVHRDIKPANFLVPRQAIAEAFANPDRSAQGKQPALIKVVDFGLARVSSSSTAKTLQLQNEKTFVGTPDYVAPEQARDIHSVDIRTDLYSLGCSFYFALTGQKPFRARHVMEIIVQHLEKEAAPIKSCRPEVPPALASIIRRLMAKKPDKRFQTPMELLAELDFFFGTSEGWARSGSPMPQRSVPATAPQPVGGDEPRFVIDADSGPGLQGDEVERWRATRVLPAPDLDGAYQPLPTAVTEGPPHAGAADGLAKGTPGSHGVANAPAARDAAVGCLDTVARCDCALVEAWKRWLAVIECVCEKGHADVSESDYRRLYDDLRECCRKHVARAKAAERPFFQRIEDLMTPWLSVRSLAFIDRDALARLLQDCRVIEAQLGIRRSGGILRWMAVGAGLIAACSLGWFMVQAGPTFSGVDMSLARSIWASMEAHPILSLAVIFPAIMAGSFALLGRASRS
jgi:tRNA A-37 threonylcarbamoyl transferase component Bud32